MFTGSICLRPDVIFDVFDLRRCHKLWLGVCCGVCFCDEKGFHVGFNIKLPQAKHKHGISDMTTSWTLMSSYSYHRPPFGTSNGTSSIYTSWPMPLCLGLVQFLRLAAKEHKNGKRNDVDDDDTGATATTDVTITVDNDAATASVEEDEGNHLW